jgi:GNAT superfamily N-acetyltransferase
VTGTIERATEADADALVSLMRRFYAEEGYPFDEPSTREALGRLLADERFGAAWVMRVAGDAVGYLVVTFGFSLEFKGRDAFVDELFVLDAHRGRGLGTAALATAEAHCRANGVAALHLEVEHANARAKALYTTAGYAAHTRHLMTKWLGRGGAD